MNKYIKLIVILAAVTPFWSCGDDFLDADVTQYVTQERHEEMISDPNVAPNVSKAALAQTYAIFQEFWASHDDFGLKAFQLATDVMCEDVITGPNWFRFDYMLENRESNYRRTNSTWKQNYSIISKVNLHLETYFAQDSDDPAIKEAKSEPLALRGIAYFNLVNFYQHTYKGHENSLGVPLTLKTTDDKLPRATVQEVYNQIIADLTFAVENGPETSNRTDADRFVAAAYLAKVYAQMEDWANVAKYAAIAKNGGTDIVSAPGRDWSIAAADMLWGYDVNTQNSTLWASYWSHMDQFLARGYAAGGTAKKSIFNALYNKLPQNDSRRKLWVNNEQFPDIVKQMKAGDKNGAVKMEDFDQLKFVAGDAGMEQDYCFIRVQDPILLEIEAKIELNQLAEASALLKDFVSKRNPNFELPTSQEELRKEVRFQRRVELWAEGTNWFDMKRWKQTIDRTVQGTNHWSQFVCRTDEPKFYHMLPISEIEANPLLKQNDPVK